MIVRELITKLGFEFDQRTLKNFDKSVTSAKNKTNDLVSAVRGLKNAFIGFVGLRIAKGFVDFTVEAARSIAATDELAKKANISTQSLQELEAVSQSSGVAADEFTNSIISLNKAVGNASLGVGTASKDFMTLGVNIKDSNGNLKENSDLYAEVAEKIRALNDPAKELIYSQKLLGNASARLVDTFSQGTDALQKQKEEARKLITVIDDKGIKTTNRFLRAWDTFRLVIKNVRDSLALGLMPALTETIENIKNWYLENKEIIDQNIKDFVDGLSTAFKILNVVISTLLVPVKFLTNLFGGFSNTVGLLTVFLGLARIAYGRLTAAMFLNPFTAVIAVIALLITELYHWVQGNETAIEKVLGSWEDFSKSFKKITDTINQYYKNLFKSLNFVGTKIGSKIGSFANNVRERTIFRNTEEVPVTRVNLRTGQESQETITRPRPRPAPNLLNNQPAPAFANSPVLRPDVSQLAGKSGTGNIVNQSITEHITVNVPAGTSVDQAQAIKDQVTEALNEQWGYNMARGLSAIAGS